MRDFKKISSFFKVIRRILEVIWFLSLWFMDFFLDEWLQGISDFMIAIMFFMIPLGFIGIFGVLDCYFYKKYLESRGRGAKNERF